MTELLIDSQEVKRVLLNCLYTDEEVGDGVPDGAVVVEGIVSTFAFHPSRLEEKREAVVGWLRVLPHEFRKSGGGGWSFMNACNQENGVQWTGLHERMDELFCLGIGLDLVECPLPRPLWVAMPGEMPYYVINVDDEEILEGDGDE